MSAVTGQYCLFHEGGRMMENIRQYLLSVTASAIICSLITSITEKKGTYAAIVRMLCGLFMAITMISPLLHIRLSDFSVYYGSIMADADTAASNGSFMANEAMAAIIKRETETYILDKASSMGLSLEVEVSLSDSDTQQPQKVWLRGAASPYAKQKLKEMIANDLGIPEENQTWT